jgi:hypothetical protein
MNETLFPDDQVQPVLSLWNPWAILFALGEKKFETRHWPLPKRFIGKTVLIHAAQRWTLSEKEYCKNSYFREALQRHPEVVGYDIEQQVGVAYRKVHLGYGDNFVTLPFGCLIGAVRFLGSVKTENLTGRDVTAQEVAFGNYEPGRFAWIAEEHRVIKPFVACVGRQGFFNYRGVLNASGNRDIPRIGDRRPAPTGLASNSDL